MVFDWEVTNFMIERIVDAAVEELNLDPIGFRRDNFIQPEEFPYQIPTGNLYDSGNYPGALDMALQMLDYDAWREKQQLARTQGRYVGIGVSKLPREGRFQRDRVMDAQPRAGICPDEFARKALRSTEARPARPSSRCMRHAGATVRRRSPPWCLPSS